MIDKHTNESLPSYNMEIICNPKTSLHSFPGFTRISGSLIKAEGLSLKQCKQFALKARFKGCTPIYYKSIFEAPANIKNVNDIISDNTRCMYCGKYFDRQHIFIDYLVPVSTVKKSRLIQSILIKSGYNCISDKRNIVTTCRDCLNKKYYTKSFSYVLRGILGKQDWYWKYRQPSTT